MPDPERWLKKRERTKVEGRNRRGKKEGMGAGATQGAAVSDVKTTATGAGFNPTGPAATSVKKGKKGR